MTSQPPRQIKTIVGHNLRAARDTLAMTQREVGEAIGATPNDVARWEAGRVEPGSKYRQELARVLFDGDLSAMYREPDEVAA